MVILKVLLLSGVIILSGIIENYFNIDSINKKIENPKVITPVSMDWYFKELNGMLSLLDRHCDRRYYDYQRKWLFEKSRFKSCGKPRQSGLTFTSAGIEPASRGMFLGVDTLYTSRSSRQYNRGKRYLKGTLTLLQKVYPWLEIVKDNTAEGELSFTSIDPEGNIRPEPVSVYFLPSRDISDIEGFPGRVFIDEFSNIPNDRELYASLIPSIGSNSLFDFGVQFRARGKQNLAYEIHINKDNQYPGFARHFFTIDDAIADGLPFDKETMFANLTKEAILEHYYVVFLDEGYAPFTKALVKSCELPEFDIRSLELTGTKYGGWDFAHERNQSICTVYNKGRDGHKTQIELMELTGLSNPEQKRRIANIITRLGLRGMAIEYTGAGITLCQDLHEDFGKIIIPFVTSNPNQTESAENFKYDLQDKNITLIENRLQREDICSVKRTFTTTRLVKYEGKKGTAHADYFRANCLANWACDQAQTIIIEKFKSVKKKVFQTTGRIFRRGKISGY